MKKLLSILSILLLIFACSSSDDGGEEQNPCPQPAFLSAQSITNTTAILDWSTQGVQTSLQEIQYGPLGFALGSGTSETIPDSSFNVSDLMPSTQYSYYVRIFCPSTNGFSDWTGPYAFVTTENNNFCNDPSQLDVNPFANGGSIGTDFVNLRWEDPEFNGGQVQYGFQNFTLGTGTLQLENDDSYDSRARIENLFPNTSYDFYVRNNCEQEGFSEWIGPINVTTNPVSVNPNCLDPTNFSSIGSGSTGGSNSYFDFSWTHDPSQNSWEIVAVAVGSPFSTSNLIATSFEPVRLNYTSLSAGQAYDFYIRANCGTANGLSGWVGPITVTAQ